MYLEGLRIKIDELFSFLPAVPVRESYIEPETIVHTIANTVERHSAQARDLAERADALQKERTDLERYELFLGTLSTLLTSAKETPDLDFITLLLRRVSLHRE